MAALNDLEIARVDGVQLEATMLQIIQSPTAFHIKGIFSITATTLLEVNSDLFTINLDYYYLLNFGYFIACQFIGAIITFWCIFIQFDALF